MSKLLEVSDNLHEDSRIVTLEGELDLHTASDARATLERAVADPSRRLVIDLTGCTFIDSTGLATIVHVTRPLRDDGHTVHLVCPKGDVRKLLELSAFNLTFPIHDRLDEVLSPPSADDSVPSSPAA